MSIVLERRLLVNLYRISMQGIHISMQERIFPYVLTIGDVIDWTADTYTYNYAYTYIYTYTYTYTYTYAYTYAYTYTYNYTLIRLIMLNIYYFYSGQPDRYKIKRQSKLTNFKANLLSGRDKKCQNVGDTQIPSDMGTPL